VLTFVITDPTDLFISYNRQFVDVDPVALSNSNDMAIPGFVVESQSTSDTLGFMVKDVVEARLNLRI
jgi:hypothetical protein